MTLNIALTTKTPSISFDSDAGVLKIYGRSLPENATDFYKPLFEEIDQYKESPKAKTKIELALEYFNTSTSRIILDIIKSVAWIEQRGNTKLQIEWKYESDDWDMEDAGNEYKQILSHLNFEVIEVERFDHRNLPEN